MACPRCGNEGQFEYSTEYYDVYYCSKCGNSYSEKK